MALVKDCMGSAQTGAYNGNAMGDISSLEPYGFDEYHKVGLEEGNNSFEKTSGLIKNSAMSHSSSSLGSPSSANSSEFVFQATNSHQTEEAHSLINFRGGFDNFMHGNNGSLLSFQQNHRVSQTGSFKGDYSTWDGNLDYNYQWSQMNPKCNTNPRLLEDFNCFQTTTNFNSMTNAKKENHGDWLYSEATIVADSIQESATQDPSSYKGRPNMVSSSSSFIFLHKLELTHNFFSLIESISTEIKVLIFWLQGESMQALKKQCNSATRKPKPKSATSKDPQSIAAKVLLQY